MPWPSPLQTNTKLLTESARDMQVSRYGEEGQSQYHGSRVAHIYTHAPPNDDTLRRALVDVWTGNDNRAVRQMNKGGREGLLATYPLSGAHLLRDLVRANW